MYFKYAWKGGSMRDKKIRTRDKKREEIYLRIYIYIYNGKKISK